MANLLNPNTFAQYQNATNLGGSFFSQPKTSFGNTVSNPSPTPIGAAQIPPTSQNAYGASWTPPVTPFSLNRPQPTTPPMPQPITPPPPTYNGPISSAVHGLGAPAQLGNGTTGNLDQHGNVLGAPPSFTINTSGPIPSDALGSNGTTNDIHSSYAQYLQQLSQASQYSPAYIQALQQVQQNALRDAQLQENQLSGAGFSGATSDFANGVTARARQQNSIDSLASNQALQVQELVRQGNIDAAKALVSGYAPQTVAPGSSLVSPGSGQSIYSGLGGYQAVQAIQTVMNLSQTYPDAGIQPNDPLQVAQQKAAASPSFQARNIGTYQLPGGGTGLYNKLSAGNVLQTSPDGKLTLVGGAEAALGAANAGALKQQTEYYNTVNSAFTKADNTLNYLVNWMQQNGINETQIPIINQINNKFAGQTSLAGIQDAFKATLQEVRTDYAQVLSRGGGLTVNVENEANKLIPDDISPDQMRQVQQALNQSSQQAISATTQQINSIVGKLGGGNTGSSIDMSAYAW